MIQVFETMAQGGVIRLPMGAPDSAHCVVTILDSGLEGLREQAKLEIPQSQQDRLGELLDKNRDMPLTVEEQRELNALAEQFDAATLLKGRALAALAQLGEQAHGS